MSELLSGVLHGAAGLLGAAFIFVFFKSIIRVGILNQEYRDPIAFWTAQVIFHLFRLRIAYLPGGRERKDEIMTWFWPCMLIGITSAWFVLVTCGFALLNLALGAEETVTAALVASGSALSTLGFSTPGSVAGKFLAIFEGGIGLFIVVYLFTFLPGFMDIIRQRGTRVAWIYHRAGQPPSGTGLLVWMARNGHLENFPEVAADWAAFFHLLANSRSFLPVLCIVRPLDTQHSWICSFGAFMDALALMNTSVAGGTEDSQICFENGVQALRNTHQSMRGTPITATSDPEKVRVSRAQYDAACALLAAAGVPLTPDREAAWERFTAAHQAYEAEIAWLAAAISDPVPAWPEAGQ